jgi:NAD(P)-dependent dehydrogenase (short-subunit alcohol dehydrogenase family)
MSKRSTDVDMRWRAVLISGATSGIGYQTARVLARGGAHVIIMANAGAR